MDNHFGSFPKMENIPSSTKPSNTTATGDFLAPPTPNQDSVHPATARGHSPSHATGSDIMMGNWDSSNWYSGPPLDEQTRAEKDADGWEVLTKEPPVKNEGGVNNKRAPTHRNLFFRPTYNNGHGSTGSLFGGGITANPQGLFQPAFPAVPMPGENNEQPISCLDGNSKPRVETGMNGPYSMGQSLDMSSQEKLAEMGRQVDLLIKERQTRLTWQTKIESIFSTVTNKLDSVRDYYMNLDTSLGLHRKGVDDLTNILATVASKEEVNALSTKLSELQKAQAGTESYDVLASRLANEVRIDSLLATLEELKQKLQAKVDNASDTGNTKEAVRENSSDINVLQMDCECLRGELDYVLEELGLLRGRVSSMEKGISSCSSICEHYDECGLADIEVLEDPEGE